MGVAYPRDVPVTVAAESSARYYSSSRAPDPTESPTLLRQLTFHRASPSGWILVIEVPYGDCQLPRTPTFLSADPGANQLVYTRITSRCNQCDSSDCNEPCRKRNSESSAPIWRPNRKWKEDVLYIAVNA